MTSLPLLVDALTAVSRSDLPAAREAATAAADADPDSLLAPVLARFLAAAGAGGVYDEPSAFEEFIDGGGNPHLYERTIGALTALHRAAAPARVLDIGCGDGRVTAAVVGPATGQVTLVEPSAELLSTARERLDRPGLAVAAVGTGIEEALDRLPIDEHWDVAQSTFALHTLPPERRAVVLRALTGRVGRIALVEFDVPRFEDRSVDHLTYLAERNELGVREYRDQPAVAHGFLMPVLVGQLDPTRHRYTFEQPATAWADELTTAGFTDTSITPVADYWWAPATLIQATGTP
ncbi:MAG: class I SAM-dependent methyltransferase [Actinomycetota bacterium]|nr:class I SAM-dependent methyltransferase [Actinomycetota bacterium]